MLKRMGIHQGAAQPAAGPLPLCRLPSTRAACHQPPHNGLLHAVRVHHALQQAATDAHRHCRLEALERALQVTAGCHMHNRAVRA